MTKPNLSPEGISQKHFIFGSLFLIANKLQVIGDKWDPNITTKQWLLVVMITQFKQEAPTISEVAELMGVSRQNIKQLALKLESKGFVMLQKDEKDSRILRIHVTQKCFDYFKQRETAERIYLEKLYEGLTPEELDGFYKGMWKMFGNIEKIEKMIEGGVL